MQIHPTRYISFKKGQIAIQGAEINKKIILFIGRSSTQKHSAPLEKLFSDLQIRGYTLVWYKSYFEATSELLDLKARSYLNLIPKMREKSNGSTSSICRKLLKALILFAYPSRWENFSCIGQKGSIYMTAKKYRALLKHLGVDKEISILAHSAGGRVASMLEAEKNIKNLICFGYPFKHPEYGEDLRRTRGLEHQQKPFLIIQGRQDEYGGEDVINRYKLAKSITIQFIDATHEYDLIAEKSWEDVTRVIENFLQPLTRNS